MPSEPKSYPAIQGHELEKLREVMRRIVMELSVADQDVVPQPGQWLPAVDLSESVDVVTIKVELPGVDAADVHATLQGTTLKIFGHKREENLATRPIRYVCLERSYGSFSRTFHLQWAIDVQAASASLIDGLLIVRLPKLRERRRREVEIPIKTE